MGETTAYDQLYRITSGAVRDAFRKHPDYLTPKGRRSATKSVVKRVTGTILGFAVQAATRQPRLAEQDARHLVGDRQASGADRTPDAGDGVRTTSSPLHSHAHVSERCYQAIRRALFPVGRREVRKDAKRFKLAHEATTASLRAVAERTRA
jgi:hypothetical protein